MAKFLIYAILAMPAYLLANPEYVGSEFCIDCHKEAGIAWADSHHAKAWTDASAENISADFTDTTFRLGKMTARFSVDGDGYFVDVTNHDGSERRYPVHSVIGVEPLQQYLLETEPGRLQSFDVVWDTEQKNWFHLYLSLIHI